MSKMMFFLLHSFFFLLPIFFFFTFFPPNSVFVSCYFVLRILFCSFLVFATPIESCACHFHFLFFFFFFFCFFFFFLCFPFSFPFFFFFFFWFIVNLVSKAANHEIKIDVLFKLGWMILASANQIQNFHMPHACPFAQFLSCFSNSTFLGVLLVAIEVFQGLFRQVCGKKSIWCFRFF